METPEVLNPGDLLTPDELAARLKVGKSWVYEKTRARSRDHLPAIRTLKTNL